MKSRRKLFILMFLFAGSSVMAQKEARQVSLKMYIPVQFNVGNYKIGYYSWGRWYVPGIEVGLNLKKKRFEQEFILGSPTLNNTRDYIRKPGAHVTYFQQDVIQSSIGIRYQAGYEVWRGAKEKVRIVPGLGFAFNGNFGKTVSYESGLGNLTFKTQMLTFLPYLHTGVNYAFNDHWGIDATVMYSPFAGYFVRIKQYFPDRSIRVNSGWWTSNYIKNFLFSRVGVSYKF